MVSHLVEEGWREGLNHHMGNKVVDGWMDGWLVGHAVVLLSCRVAEVDEAPCHPPVECICEHEHVCACFEQQLGDQGFKINDVWKSAEGCIHAG